MVLIPGGEVSLEGKGEAGGLHGTVEGGEEPVSHSLDNFTGVGGNGFGSETVELLAEAQGLGFALLHEAGVAYHIAEEDGG